MSPVETMAEAFWEAPGGSTWAYCEPERKDVIRLGMRAALDALAKAELPDGVLLAGREEITYAGCFGLGKGPSSAFSAMLREIAKDKSP